MSEPLVKIHVHQKTATILLNRPDKRNALNRAMLAELDQALHDLHMQRSARAVILSGAGSSFCAGMDLVEMQATAAAADAIRLWEQDARAYREVIEKMLRFPKPIIAAVDGAAVAGGAGLVLASDMVVASQNANFGLPEPRRGLIAGMVAPLLHFRIGAGRAAYLLLTAETIGAERACEMGIFHEVVQSDVVWARANQLAEACTASAPEALALTKRLLNETIGDHLVTMLAAGTAASSTARTTAAAAEGLAAFVEKREPNWE
ncbi:MAG: enoyl-CoA hydratase/isomerase family protein [Planctomycetales bacterium]|nr:enoyl-CoA hydratase/isomerase family protein [Planctomycetales bacterium]NIM08785.1 enoyl-CoA hydratase/isomerase family protein [Planctomycetales bacterium]NIN08249.1 enoyl-CoA hydratase/isomerase family protein [Planctomycetales bacterium]NIN77374.1 enoyl-CoA hydratase/isomerase family protein [Planctomycetales bacterium]NIO34557.1 enoyl-CoA hydratase/isomerase family protein [Planctomycetales bacterium]